MLSASLNKTFLSLTSNVFLNDFMLEIVLCLNPVNRVESWLGG